MTELLNWMGKHPILTFLLAYMLMAAIICVAGAIVTAIAGKHHCTCQCSKPTTPETAKDKE